MDTIDLHTHSTFSDGTFTPLQLVKYAEEKGLKAFALTDHDTTEGVKEAKSIETNVEVICYITSPYCKGFGFKRLCRVLYRGF